MNTLEHWLQLAEHQPLTPAFKGVFQHSIQECLDTHPSIQPGPHDLAKFIQVLGYLAEKEGPRHQPKIKADPAFDAWSARMVDWFLKYPSTPSLNDYTSIFKEVISLGSLPLIQATWKHPKAPNWATLDNKEQENLGIKGMVKCGHTPLMAYMASQGFKWATLPQILTCAKDAQTAQFLLAQGCASTITGPQTKEPFSIETYWANQCRDGRLRQKEFEKMQGVLNAFLSPSKEEEQNAFFKKMWQWSEGMFQRQLKQLNLDPDSDAFRIKAWSGWIERNSSTERLTKTYHAGQKWAQAHPPKSTDMFGIHALPIPMVLSSFDWGHHILDVYTHHRGTSVLSALKSHVEHLSTTEQIDKMIHVLSIWPTMRVSNEWDYSWSILVRNLSEMDKVYALAHGLESQALNYTNYQDSPLHRWLNAFKDCSDEPLQSQAKVFQEKSPALFSALFRFISYRENLPGVTHPFGSGELLIEKMHRLHLLPQSPLLTLPEAFEENLGNASTEVKARWLKTYQDYRLPAASSSFVKQRL